MENIPISMRTKLIEFHRNTSSYKHKPKSLKYIHTHSSDIFIVPAILFSSLFSHN